MATVGSLGSGQLMTVLIVMAAVLVPVSGIVFSSMQSILVQRYDSLLKRAMIERGMSVDQILALTESGKGGDDEGKSLPCASEAVVDSDGEWRTALVLRVSGDRYYVHFVGTEMDENDWVESAHIRFPSGAFPHDPLAYPYSNGAPEKGPIEAEI